MKVALMGYGGMTYGGIAEAFYRLAQPSLTAKKLMEAFAALEAELAETSPRSSISRPRFQEYKHQDPLAKTRYGRPWSSWRASGSIFPSVHARGPPQIEVQAQIKGQGAVTPQPVSTGSPIPQSLFSKVKSRSPSGAK